MGHHPQKSSYDDNLFLIHLPAAIFLVIGSIIMVISAFPSNPGENKQRVPYRVDSIENAKRDPVTPIIPEGVDAGPIIDRKDIEAGLALIKGSDCYNCHKDTEKLLGPSFADISAAYSNTPEKWADVAKKIITGGAGKWGQTPMTAHAISQEDALSMLNYVMSIKGGSVPETFNAGGEVVVEKLVASELYEKLDCKVCHQIDKKSTGPSFKAIAKKYENTEENKGKLINKVKTGGAGTWGDIPEIPHTNLSDEEIGTMIDWIFSLEKSSSPKKEEEGAKIHAKYRCDACHKMDQKLVGPSLKDIAKRYKDKDVKDMLFDKVRNGGTGNWGQVPMIKNENIPDKELKEVISWILNLR